eukprot:m.314860 g.314860  ORF g.314860 m.314860 type:complete len:271 (-) comp16412_c0_seq18:1728-2540(-)
MSSTKLAAEPAFFCLGRVAIPCPRKGTKATLASLSEMEKRCTDWIGDSVCVVLMRILQVGLATAATIIGMPTAGTQLTYSGPIVSGAVIGSWTPSPLPDILVSSLSALRTCTLTVRVPIRQLETSAAAKTRLEQAEERLVKVRSGDLVDDVSVRDATALVEQARRNLAKIVDFESSEPGRVKIWIWQLGDIFLVATSGEPYSAFQIELRQRVPSGVTVIVAAMTNGSMTPGYVLMHSPLVLGELTILVDILPTGTSCLQNTLGVGAIKTG